MIPRPPRPTDEEFEALKRKRDASTEASIQRICDEKGWNRAEIDIHCRGAGSACYCACPDGPCQHVWDGPDYEEEDGYGCMISATCSRCGAIAAYHDMRVMP